MNINQLMQSNVHMNKMLIETTLPDENTLVASFSPQRVISFICNCINVRWLITKVGIIVRFHMSIVINAWNDLIRINSHHD